MMKKGTDGVQEWQAIQMLCEGEIASRKSSRKTNRREGMHNAIEGETGMMKSDDWWRTGVFMSSIRPRSPTKGDLTSANCWRVLWSGLRCLFGARWTDGNSAAYRKVCARRGEWTAARGNAVRCAAASSTEGNVQ